MSRLPKIAAAIALGALASACTPMTGALTPTSNPSLYSLHQPVVERTDFVLELAAGGNGLSPVEQDRLRAWLDSIDAGWGDRIAIDQPYGTFDPALHRDVSLVAEQYGLDLADAAPVVAGEIRPGTVRVIASRSSAHVPGCPLWSETGVVPTSETSSNYGCSVNSNLAAMVANPEDLVLGRDGTSEGSGTIATRAVRSYRERAPSGRQSLPTPTTSN